jgi:hypothetical protein
VSYLRRRPRNGSGRWIRTSLIRVPEEWWRQWVTLRPRRSCKDHPHPCAVPMVPRVGFEPTSPRLQRGAFTRLDSSAQIGASSVIETEFPKWRSGARSFQLRPHGGKWTESNFLPAGTTFTARRRHQPVLMALPLFGCGPRGCTGPSRLMRASRTRIPRWPHRSRRIRLTITARSKRIVSTRTQRMRATPRPSCATNTWGKVPNSVGLFNPHFLNSFGQAAVLDEQIEHGLSEHFVHLALLIQGESLDFKK